MILSISNGKQPHVPEHFEKPVSMPTVEQNVLASDAILRGSIEFNGELLVEGTVEGKIISQTGDVVIGTSSSVSADIESVNANIEGEVKGNLNVRGKTVLSQGSVLIGDLISSTVELETGAVFWGKSQVGTRPKKEKADK